MNGRKARAFRKLAKAAFNKQPADLKQQAAQTPYDLEPALNAHGIKVGYKQASPRRLHQNSERYIYQFAKKRGLIAPLDWIKYLHTRTTQS